MTTIDDQAVKALLTRARREIDQGLLPSCQLALALDGDLVLFEALGDATTDTRYVVFSATKAWVASVMWQLLAEGAVDLGAKVADLIPEFGTNGKDVITVEQVMLHTSGFPHAPMKFELWDDRAGRVERMSEWRLNWEPGTRYEYHPTSAHWVLAEIITRVTGVDHGQAVKTRVADPLGLRLDLGLPPERQEGIATLVSTGDLATADELEAVLGVRDLPETEVTDEALLLYNRPEVRAAGNPGAGGITTADQLALFYQGLLSNPGQLWDPAVLADATSRVRNSLPDPLGVPANRALGVVVAGDDGLAGRRGHGKTGSPRRFGHNGAGGQIAWADPESGLSFAYLTNGLDAHVLRQPRRGIALSSLAAVCAV